VSPLQANDSHVTMKQATALEIETCAGVIGDHNPNSAVPLAGDRHIGAARARAATFNRRDSVASEEAKCLTSA